MGGMSISPKGDETLTTWGGDDNKSGHLGAGFVGGAILGGGVGYILSREVGDLKGVIGETKADIAKSQASVEKEIAGVTMNLKDQICATEKLISAEAQRTNGLLGGMNDTIAARFSGVNDKICGVEKEILQSQYQSALNMKDLQKQISDCCCQTGIRLTELECCCKATQQKLDCMQRDLENAMVIQAKDNEIQRLKDQAVLNERFCTLEKGQQAILDKLDIQNVIAAAKNEAIEKFKVDQMYNKVMAGASA